MKKLFTLLLLSVLQFGLPAALKATEPEKNACSRAEEVTMHWSYEQQTNTVKVSILEKEVKEKDPEQWQYLNSHTSYPFEVDVALPEELWKGLGSAQPIVIKTGSYPIALTNGSYEIRISL